MAGTINGNLFLIRLLGCAFFFRCEVDTGEGIRSAVLETGINAVTTGNGMVIFIKDMDVVLAKMLAVLACGVIHNITSICSTNSILKISILSTIFEIRILK